MAIIRLAIIIVNYNTRELLAECLTAVRGKVDAATTEVIVVDNASTDGSTAMVAHDFSWVRLVAHSENVGFGAGNNLGVAATHAPYIMLLNSDAILVEDTGAALVDFLKSNPDVVAVAPQVLLTNGRRQPRVFGNLPTLWRLAMQSLDLGAILPRQRLLAGIDGRDLDSPKQDVGWISGVCIVMRREDYCAVGGFDPSMFMYCEDIDLCWRLRLRGGRIVRIDSFGVVHHGGGSSRSVAGQLRNVAMQQRNLLRTVAKHRGSAVAITARLIILGGLVPRLALGAALVPRRGIAANLLLRGSWLRLRTLFERVRNDCF